MLVHGFTSDLPSKSLFPKRPRSNSHRLRSRIWHKATPTPRASSTPPPAISSPAAVPSWTNTQPLPLRFPFTFTLPEWAATWNNLRDKLRRTSAKKSVNQRRADPAFQISFDTLATDLKNLRLSKCSGLHDFTLIKAKPSTKSFRLLDLPREIRDLIYAFALVNPTSTLPSSSSNQRTRIHVFHERKVDGRMFLSRVDPSIYALLSTCRSVFSEGLPIFYRLNRFYLRGIACTKPLLRLRHMAFRNIQYLDVTLSRNVPLQLDLIPIFTVLSSLPRLREATLQRYAEYLRTLLDGHEHFAPKPGNCKDCIERSAADPISPILSLLDDWPRLIINIVVYSKIGIGTPPAMSCPICALFHGIEQKRLWKEKNPTQLLFDIQPILVSICRSSSTVSDSTSLGPPHGSSDTHPVFLPSLADSKSIGCRSAQPKPRIMAS